MTVTIRHGDCREVLRTLPDGSAHCCVTSPPYFGLRDYGMAGQIGLELTPDYDSGECWNCGGEGRVAGTCIDGCCVEQDDPDCPYCSHRCDVCNPTKPKKVAPAIGEGEHG